MRAKVQRWGNSLALRIPKKAAETVGVRQNDHVELEIEPGKLVMLPVRRGYRLGDLLAEITDENLHEPVDTGDPVGREGL